MDSPSYETYCPTCDKLVQANLTHRSETLRINGEDVEHDARVLICPHCNTAIGDVRIDQQNFETADRIYRARHNIPTRFEFRELRARYGMSVREFSRYLGFGEQTYATYERAAIPDELHLRMIRIASTPEGARLLIPLAEGSISEKSLRLARAFAYPEGAAGSADTASDSQAAEG